MEASSAEQQPAEATEESASGSDPPHMDTDATSDPTTEDLGKDGDAGKRKPSEGDSEDWPPPPPPADGAVTTDVVAVEIHADPESSAQTAG